MRIAYLECATGISGDMTLAALLDAGVDQSQLEHAIASLRLPGVHLEVTEVMQSCFRAKSITVKHPPQHAHRHWDDIVRILEQADALTGRQRQTAMEIFRAIAEAEAHVHGTSIETIHFHEVGAVDSIVDIVGVAVGFDLLGVDRIVCSPVPTGHGHVRIDHGVCPIPTPGTAELLRGIPLCDVAIEAELTTPTGAAIVRALVDQFGRRPAMTIDRIGYGAGTMEFPNRANMLRLFVGTASSEAGHDEVCLLETNLDDVSAEVIGHAKQRLLNAGALDVYTVPIQMKKDRPGTMLCVICRPGEEASSAEILFGETGTLGVRRQIIQRSIRARQTHTVVTDFGPIVGKVAWKSDGTAEFSPEFEDCARLAREQHRPLREIYRAALTAFDQHQSQHTIERATTGQHPIPDHDHSHDHDHSQDHDHDHRHDDHGHDLPRS